MTAHRELTVSSRWAHGEFTVSSWWPKWSQPVMTWAVIELWPSRDRRDWAVTSPWLSCDLVVTELRPSLAVTEPWSLGPGAVTTVVTVSSRWPFIFSWDNLPHFERVRTITLYAFKLKLLVLPIDIENPYRLSNCLYRYISIYIGFLATNF